MEQEYHYLFKILLIGDSAVGKTSLLLRYVDDVYNPEFKTTIGVDFKISTMELDSKIVKLQLWDTAGQDKFRNIVASYYRGANGIIIMYDITNRESFDNVRRWYDETRSYLQEDIPKLLVGNKVDVASQRSVDLADAADLANSLGMQYIETSAKTNTNIKEAFTSMTRSILNKVSIIRSQQTAATGGTQLGGGQPISKKGCCRG
jgi:Ras-related protein Rab-1A